jgi:hypothetical protein
MRLPPPGKPEPALWRCQHLPRGLFEKSVEKRKAAPNVIGTAALMAATDAQNDVRINLGASNESTIVAADGCSI